MIKRLSVFVLVVLVCSALFASGSSEKSGKTTVTIWHSAQGSNAQVFENLAQDFNNGIGKEKNIEKVGSFCANEYIKLGVSRRLLCQQEKSRYLVERGLLKIVKEDDKLFFIDKKTNEKIYAQVIHAQGDAKKYMKMVLYMKGNFMKVIDMEME